MSNFIFAYHGGKKPETPEAIAEIMNKWTTWIESLGSAVVDPGNPVGLSKTVSASGVVDNGGPNPLAGFSIVKADTMNAVLEMAKTCPHLEHGTVEVAEIMQI